MIDPKLLRQATQDVADKLSRRGFALDAKAYQDIEKRRKETQVATEQLQSVYTQVQSFFIRAPGHHQWPGNQWAGIAGPAGLDGQLMKVYIGALFHMVLAGRVFYQLWPHIQHLFEHRCFAPGIAQPLGRVGLSQVGEKFANFSQC